MDSALENYCRGKIDLAAAPPELITAAELAANALADVASLASLQFVSGELSFASTAERVLLVFP